MNDARDQPPIGVIKVIGLIGDIGRMGLIGAWVVGVMAGITELKLLLHMQEGCPCRSWVFPLNDRSNPFGPRASRCRRIFFDYDFSKLGGELARAERLGRAAVVIEPVSADSLRKTGIFADGPEISSISPPTSARPGVWRPRRMYKKPGFPAYFSRSLREPGLTRDCWLPWEGSNSHITDRVSAFEIFEEFRLFCRFAALETFGNSQSKSGARRPALTPVRRSLARTGGTRGSRFLGDRSPRIVARWLFRLWTWTCWPARTLRVSLPIGVPYFRISWPAARSENANLWPKGMGSRRAIFSIRSPQRTRTIPDRSRRATATSSSGVICTASQPIVVWRSLKVMLRCA